MRRSILYMMLLFGCDDGASDPPVVGDAGVQDGAMVDMAEADGMPPDMGASVGERQVLQPDGDRVYPGWYTHDVAGEQAGYEAVIGRTPPVVFTFHDWNANGPAAAEVRMQTFDAPLEGEGTQTVLEAAEALADRGAILAVAWDAIGYIAEEETYWTGTLDIAVTFDDVLSGQHDDYIRACAREIKAMGRPIMLSPLGEMNSIAWFMFGADEKTPLYAVDDTRAYFGDPTVPDGPERARALFRHVVDIFREEQVPNVTWFLYAATGYMNPAFLDMEEIERLDEAHPRHFHPGDDYVDWIGTSLYVQADRAGDFAAQLDLAYAAWRTVSERPFFAPEFGVVASEGQERVATIENLIETLPSSGVDLVTFADSALYALIFDIPRLSDRPTEAEAWRAVHTDPRYSTTLQFAPRTP
jgi:hypothetical protein